MRDNRFTTVTIAFTLAALILIPQRPAQAQQASQYKTQKAAQESYQKAYNYILDSKWSSAKKAFTDYVDKFRKGDMIDAASYWLCYSRGKLETTREAAFECYQDFIKKYPGSKWVNDARSEMVSLASQLAREGKPEYQASLQKLDEADDEDVKLAALYALAGMGSDKALSTVSTLYDKTQSDKIRSKIVYVLGSFETAESRKKLTDIALNDKNTRVRRDAVYALANNDSPEVLVTLKSILKLKTDGEVREAALYSLANLGNDKEALVLLSEIARTDPDKKMAKVATYSLGNIDNSTAVVVELRRIIKEAKIPEVQEAAIHVLGNSDDPESIIVIKEIALKSTN